MAGGPPTLEPLSHAAPRIHSKIGVPEEFVDHSDVNVADNTLAKQSKDFTPIRKKKGGTSIFVSGVGFLADAYDLFAIDFIVAILAVTTATPPTPSQKGIVVSATLAGAVVGQLAFGAAADFLGRRIMFIATAALVIVGALSSASVGIGYREQIDPSFPIFYQLAITRFLMGLGIGGEYPLAATVTCEANEGTEEEENGCCWYLYKKPNSVAAVFSMQGLGMLLSPLLVLIFVSSGLSLEATWRICIALGAVPSSIAFFFRWRMSETTAFTEGQQLAQQRHKDNTSPSKGGLTNTEYPEGPPQLVKGEAEIEMVSQAVTPKMDEHAMIAESKTGLGVILSGGSSSSSSSSSSSGGSEAHGKRRWSAHRPRQLPPEDEVVRPRALSHRLVYQSDIEGQRESGPSAQSCFMLGSALSNRHPYSPRAESPAATTAVDRRLSSPTPPSYAPPWRDRQKFVSLDDFGRRRAFHLGGPHGLTPRVSDWFAGRSSNPQPPDSRQQQLSPEIASSTKEVALSPRGHASMIEIRRSASSSTLSTAEGKPPEGEKKGGKKGQLRRHLKASGGALKRMWRPMIGTALSWFLIDVTLYGNGSFKSAVMGQWFAAPPKSSSQKLRLLGDVSPFSASFLGSPPQRGALVLDAAPDLSTHAAGSTASQLSEGEARGQIVTEAKMGVVVALLAIPGYILSVLFCHKIGLRRLQLYGFVAVGTVFIVLGCEQLSKPKGLHVLELILFGLTFLFSNFGPNSTTFILPTQLYPSLIRATCHGLSAAMGKLGGVVGSSLFSILQVELGLGVLLVACGGVALVGSVITYFFIPVDTKDGKVLQDPFNREYRNCEDLCWCCCYDHRVKLSPQHSVDPVASLEI